MKKKFLLPILSVCMVVALVSVGFAAWLITGHHTEDAQGQFVTYNVSNEYFKVTVTPTGAGANENKIVFGKPATATVNHTTDWFQFDNDVGNASLSVAFTITIDADVDFVADSFTPATVLGSNKIKLKLTETPKTPAASTTYNKFDTAKGAGYVTAPTFKINDDTDNATVIDSATATMATGYTIELSASNFEIGADNNATATVTVTFDWGTAFNGQNPFTYYNGLTGGANGTNGESTNRAVAQTAMEALHALNETIYHVILSVEA